MGEVYRARDSKLGRDVALKLLPDVFTNDVERVSRFRREARILATLNHPHIAAVYGIEESDGVHALVMELVEGEDLAARIVPRPDAAARRPTARETDRRGARSGPRRRDHSSGFKPANIKVREDGTVKLLDFGLAKVLEPPSRGALNSRTASVDATEVGRILGTPGHMSPEQASAKPADKRTDIWAFGVVLCEMLTGRPLYRGDSAAEILARVIEREPDLSGLPAATPPSIRALIGRCLTKDPRSRLQAIGDARIALDRAIAHPQAEALLEVEPGTARYTTGPLWQWALPWALVVAFAGAGLVLWAPWRPAPEGVPLRLNTELGVDASLAIDTGDALALSPDGRTAAFVARTSADRPAQLFVRRLGDLKVAQATALPGTDGAESPFFSPDGQQVAFFADNKLKRVPVAGDASVTICDVARGDAPGSGGGTWAEDGTILFAPARAPGVSLWQVSSAGGTAERLASLGEGEFNQAWPQVLPGGVGVLYTASDRPGAVNDANIVVQPLPSGAPKIVHRGGYHGRYVPTGHLVYVHDGVLFAVPFDLERLQSTGHAVSVLDGITSSTYEGSAQFAVSTEGTLMYIPGRAVGGARPVDWMDRTGTTTPLWRTPANWFSIRFAPDGRRLAMEILSGPTPDIWIYDWERDTATPLTRHPANELKAVWTSDGRRVAFNSDRDNSPHNLYWQRADGTGAAQRLTESKKSQWPVSWHPSGRFLAFEEHDLQMRFDQGWDLMLLPIEGDEVSGWRPGTATTILATPSEEMQPNFSPDGRWLAYQSNEAGRYEVYVRPFRGPGDGWRISTGGGTFPTWSRTKRELFYGVNGQIMVAAYAVEGDAFRAEKPRVLPNVRYREAGPARMFDLHPDGERFAVAPPDEAPTRDSVVVILNFFDELRRMTPSTNN